MTDSIEERSGTADDTAGAFTAVPDGRPPLRPGELDITLTIVDEESGEIRDSAVVRVPPFQTWKSSARSALLSRGDDMSWAALTLSRDDANTWIDLDPPKSDVDRFFADYEKAGGMSNNRSERRRHLRSA